jgi:hypothetical protein
MVSASPMLRQKELRALLADCGASARSRDPGTLDLAEFVAEHRGESPATPSLGRQDIAFLTYTSRDPGTGGSWHGSAVRGHAGVQHDRAGG